MTSQKVLIVGGVAGGASAAARLRRLDEQAEIILFERGEYISFANCGLPYYIGGEITDKSALTLQTPKSFRARFNVDVRIQNEVTAIDREQKSVTVHNLKTGETYQESYDKLILSMGADPVVPPIDGIQNPKVFTLRNIPDTYKIKGFIQENHPKSAVVVGGGYIGVEMAENLHHAGLDVTIVEMLDQVIAPLDFDMAADVHRHILSKGVKLMLKTTVKGVKEADNGLTVVLDKGEVQADMVILSIGVRPESKIAKAAGLEVTPRGAIVVTDDMRTTDKDIFAVGDAIQVTDFVTQQPTVIPLAGPANKQGRIAADNVCGRDSRYTGTQGSSILKVFDMTVATTGINEKTAKRLELNYDKVFTYSASHASYYPGAVNMAIKTVFEKETGRILGAQIVGYEGADKRIDVLATAIRFGAKAADLTKLELAYAPPYSSAKDPVNMAGFVIENLLTGTVKNFHWHDVKNLPRDGSVTLLDTRTQIEYENGHIDGFINIPLDSLREHLDELDKTKPVYITCQVGLRGYVGARILMGNGFETYNLSGGYRLYNSIFGVAPTSTVRMNPETQLPEEGGEKLPKITPTGKTINIDACGLQCPGPIVKLSQAIKEADKGDLLEIKTTDPAFACDIEGFCRRTGNCFEGMVSDKGVATARIRKGPAEAGAKPAARDDGKNIIVFSGDLDKAIASFIIANGSAAMGRKTSMFFTFWGLNILRKTEKVKVKKTFMEKMFGAMMPRGTKKLKLSSMNMGGMGGKMIRGIMQKKNVESLESLMQMAIDNGVELIACSMSMDIMGIKKEELIDGVTVGGVAAMLAHAEESDMSLFI
ncbi:MAG TPA: FAD-dependent oxidoreductase [Candidatus Limiplasma sp.]|nr:FAD-dependent oxidoreductase [Candidatus Limiplasma sp.]